MQQFSKTFLDAWPLLLGGECNSSLGCRPGSCNVTKGQLSFSCHQVCKCRVRVTRLECRANRPKGSSWLAAPQEVLAKEVPGHADPSRSFVPGFRELELQRLLEVPARFRIAARRVQRRSQLTVKRRGPVVPIRNTTQQLLKDLNRRFVIALLRVIEGNLNVPADAVLFAHSRWSQGPENTTISGKPPFQPWLARRISLLAGYSF